MDRVEKLKKILRTEYGINNSQEFETALQNFKGINIGIFTTPLSEKGSDEECAKFAEKIHVIPDALMQKKMCL